MIGKLTIKRGGYDPELPRDEQLLLCPNCGRTEAEHDGTERHGCIVFWPATEPVESWNARNEQAKSERASFDVDKCVRDLDALANDNPSCAPMLRKVAAFLTDELGGLRQDAERWRLLAELVKKNHMHKGLGGGVILAAAPANEFDKPWASVQAIDHDNPRNALWIFEAESLDAAIDAARSLPTEPTEDSTNAE